jgi:hypothetical protein
MPDNTFIMAQFKRLLAFIPAAKVLSCYTAFPNLTFLDPIPHTFQPGSLGLESITAGGPDKGNYDLFESGSQ